MEIISKRIKIIAPGRTCLFGDHQDYLGLPVIACAIDKYITLNAITNTTSRFIIKLPDIGEERVIGIHEKFESIGHRDYFASSLKVLHRYQCIPDKGYDIEIKGDLPINAGVSSSSALIIAWIRFLLKAFGADREITNEFVAKIAYESEVVEHREPGGLMDQYAIGLGGVLFIETGKKISYKILKDTMPGLIVGESGVKKETIFTLGDRKEKALKAIAHVTMERPDFNLETTSVEMYEIYEKYIPIDLKPYFFAALKNHAITLKALKEFGKRNPNMKYIGDLMNQHHLILKNILKITVPVIDKMVASAIEAGAYGVKIVGSGGGGSIIAIAPKEKEQQVVEAMKQEGKTAYIVNVDPGARVV